MSRPRRDLKEEFGREFDFRESLRTHEEHDPRYRIPRSFVLISLMLATILLEAFAYFFPVFLYSQDYIQVAVHYDRSYVCPDASGVPGTCEENGSALCPTIESHLSFASAMLLIAVVLASFNVLFLLVDCFGGVVHPYLSKIFSVVAFFVILAQWAALSAIYERPLCKNVSFKELQLSYSVGWILPFVGWCLFLIIIPLIFYLDRLFQIKIFER